MERKDKRGVIEELSEKSFHSLGSDFSVSKEDIMDFLHSAIFYRSLYDMGFAARHRTDKTLKRTIKDLSNIIERH